MAKLSLLYTWLRGRHGHGFDLLAEEVDHVRPLADYSDQDPYSLKGAPGHLLPCHQAKTA
jgi:hypothetical protein